MTEKEKQNDHQSELLSEQPGELSNELLSELLNEQTIVSKHLKLIYFLILGLYFLLGVNLFTDISELP